MANMLCSMDRLACLAMARRGCKSMMAVLRRPPLRNANRARDESIKA